MNSELQQAIRIARIRTSDRITFRRCRRKWSWNSHLRGNRDTLIRENPEPLWTGTGVHFALEDFHGYQQYASPSQAFLAFVEACRKTPRYKLPALYKEETERAVAMMDHYLVWLEDRPELETFWVDGKPQCEVNFTIPLDGTTVLVQDPELLGEYDQVVYGGTFDRIAIDENGHLWIVEYKTAKAFEVFHFDNDAQVTAYCWAAQFVYPDHIIAGVVYQQHKKTIPDEPRFLKSGRFSCNKDQSTTARLYRKALDNVYGSLQQAPTENIKFYDWLDEQESEHSDKFIRRDYTTRNKPQLDSEHYKIYAEAKDMLNLNLPLYPNPTRNCAYDCDYLPVCIAMDSGDFYYEPPSAAGTGEELMEAELDNISQFRTEEDESWRMHL